MSATLQAEHFSKYFNGADVVYISGRQYPVTVMYTYEPEPDYLDAAIITVLQIHLNKKMDSGDILVFLTGQEEIETARKMLEEKIPKLPHGVLNILVTPIYAALPSHQQLKVFEPTPEGYRKVIFATNIAETSITINGIQFVVDTGVTKVRQYNPMTGVDSLVIVPIAKSESWQRTGRAGRESAGICYRLYTENSFHELRPTILPEILRCNLCSVVLELKSLGVQDILGFDFLDKPPQTALIRALENLYALRALNNKGFLTKPLGYQMARLPLNPLFSKVLILSSSEQFYCSEEMLSLVAMLNAEDTIFYTPHQAEKRSISITAKRSFVSYYGDHLTYLEVYQAFKLAKNKKQWCIENFINYRALLKTENIRKQLHDVMCKLKLPILSCGISLDQIRRCLVTGFFLHAARSQGDGSYRSLLDKQKVFIHPSSVLHGRKPLPASVIYNQLVTTSRKYMREITIIEMPWLPELVPAFFKSTNTMQQKLAKLKNQHS